MEISVQDLLSEELLSVDQGSETNDTLRLLEFIRDEGVPLTNAQSAGLFLLRENGLEDLASYVLNVRKRMTPTKKFMTLIDKLTLADRIKGNAKLSSILKANANPANATNANLGKEPRQ